MTLLFPFPNLTQIRENLTPIDLNNQVVTAGSLIDKPKPPWESCASFLARYGLVMSNQLHVLGKKVPVKQKFFIHHLRGPSSQPNWTLRDEWNTKHRAYLVLLGWLRYLRDRGANRAYVQTELGIEDLSDLVMLHKTPPALETEFRAIELKLTGPECDRAYSQFMELPAAYGLYPT